MPKNCRVLLAGNKADCCGPQGVEKREVSQKEAKVSALPHRRSVSTRATVKGYEHLHFDEAACTLEKLCTFNQQPADRFWGALQAKPDTQ